MAKFSISKTYLQNLLSVTTKEHERVGTAVNMIHVDGDRIYATDGHRLLSYKIHPIVPLQQKQYTIPSAEIKTLIKAGKGMIDVDLDRLSDMPGNRIRYSHIVPAVQCTKLTTEQVILIENAISTALGTYVCLKFADDVTEFDNRAKSLTVTSGHKTTWCVGNRNQASLPATVATSEIVLDLFKLGLLVDKLEWNQLHITGNNAPVVFSDSRGGAYAEMIFMIMPVEIRDRTYLDAALSAAI